MMLSCNEIMPEIDINIAIIATTMIHIANWLESFDELSVPASTRWVGEMIGFNVGDTVGFIERFLFGEVVQYLVECVDG